MSLVQRILAHVIGAGRDRFLDWIERDHQFVQVRNVLHAIAETILRRRVLRCMSDPQATFARLGAHIIEAVHAQVSLDTPRSSSPSAMACAG